jgi:hypothetical protein
MSLLDILRQTPRENQEYLTGFLLNNHLIVVSFA